MNRNTEARVLVIYTGGTIGMIRNEFNVLAPQPNEFSRKIRAFPNMLDEETGETMVLSYIDGQQRRVLYQILEYEPLLDSSNMGVPDWVRISTDIQRSYDLFDGFVILHGTDTLSYTAAALSFMLENLGKTVIITGSQIPIFETRTDGRDNFTSALILAGNYVIPEVCVFFNSRLFRGNRTIKVNCDAFRAFDSPNVAPLARMGVKVKVDYRLIRTSETAEAFTVHTQMEEKVGLLRLFPTITGAMVAAFLQQLKGVVLMTYGSGNIPTNREDFVEALRDAADRGVLIVNCTQCCAGTVSGLYEASRPLEELGVVRGFDMTPEAALAKLSYVLGKADLDRRMKKLKLLSNLRGELTNNGEH